MVRPGSPVRRMMRVASVNALSMSATATWTITTSSYRILQATPKSAAHAAVDLFSFNLGFHQERSGIIDVQDTRPFGRHIVERDLHEEFLIVEAPAPRPRR